jgi:hypothetical protein
VAVRLPVVRAVDRELSVRVVSFEVHQELSGRVQQFLTVRERDRVDSVGRRGLLDRRALEPLRLEDTKPLARLSNPLWVVGREVELAQDRAEFTASPRG